MRLTSILLVEGKARISGLPLHTPSALTPVLGRTLLDRLVAELRDGGCDATFVYSDVSFPVSPRLNVQLAADVWKCAEQKFESLTEDDADKEEQFVLLARSDAYFEFALDDLMAAHRKSGRAVTRVFSGEKPTDIYLVSTAHAGEALFLLRNELRQSPEDVNVYRLAEHEYFNALESAKHFRQLACDALYRQCRLVPAGYEVRPGIWMGKHVRVARGARIVAPAFIGAHSHIYSGSLITQGSVLEDHVSVDCGTIIENTTVLPFTRVGLGLEMAHMVAGPSKVFHLGRNVEVEIEDAKVLSFRSMNALARTAKAAVSLLTFVPTQIAAGLGSSRPPVVRTEVPAISQVCSDFGTSIEKKEIKPERKLVPGLAVVRRYGNE